MCSLGNWFGLNETVLVSPAAKVTGCSRRTPSNDAFNTPCCSAFELFCNSVLMLTSALDVSGNGNFVTTCGSIIVTGPVARKMTSCHKPVQRSRTAGIQSQPSAHWKEGPSRHIAPPLSPGPYFTDCSLGMPG